MNIYDFKIGSRVQIIKNYRDFPIGEKGRICTYHSNSYHIGISFDKYISAHPAVMLNGRMEYGHYIPYTCLRIISNDADDSITSLLKEVYNF